MSERIIPTGDNVAMRIISQERTAGGLHIPQKAQSNQRDCELAEVLAIGPGRTTESGARVEVAVRPGDHVLISRGAGVQIDTEDDKGKPMKVRLLRDMEIFAKVEESRIVELNKTLRGGKLVLP